MTAQIAVCGMLAAFQPSVSASAAAGIGAVIGSGRIQIDGAAVPSGAVIYSGDWIVTDPGNTAAIHLRNGATLALGTSTAVHLEVSGQEVTAELDRGRVAVVGGSGPPIIVAARGLTVTSQQAEGSYEVTLTGNEIEVLTRRGETAVTGANRVVEVREGILMNAAASPEPGSSRRSKILWVTLIAAAAAGGGLGIAVTRPDPTCVSPSSLNCT